MFKLKQILRNKDDVSFLKNKQTMLTEVAQVVGSAEAKDRVPLESTADGPECFLSDNLLSSASIFGEVYCQPCPSRFTARGEGLIKAFVNQPATFKVEARDRYARRSVVSGTSVGVVVKGPLHHLLPTQIEEKSKGEYLVTYTPTHVGYHLIRITADGQTILQSDHHVVVFNKNDYLLLGIPQKVINIGWLRSETPVANIRSVNTLPNGNIIFMDAFCLRVINPASGLLVCTIGSYGTNHNQFCLPFDMSINYKGDIFVSDRSMHRIAKFLSNGQHKFSFGSHGSRNGNLSSPEGLAVLGEEKLYVTDSGNNRVQVFSQRNGKYLGGFGKKGTGAGQFNAPCDIAIDMKNSRVLVSDTGNSRIQALTFDGKPLTQFGFSKGGSVYLKSPFSVVVDEDGFILVTETKCHYVTILTPRGSLVRRLGSSGDAPGQFRTPYGICVSPNKAQVIITDSTNNSIQIF